MQAAISSLVIDPLEGLCVGGRYTLQKKLSQGSTGAVYQAEQSGLSRRVAIKVLHPHLLSRPQALTRFQREALALAKLSHPYTVKIYDQGEERGIVWIALEWLEGETLEQRLAREKTLPEEEVISLLLALCDLLEEAHACGILHRDIKPSNIFLVPLRNGKRLPKLLDFGLASLQGIDALTSSESISGTPKYMSPEQWDGLRSTDARSDLYSLCITAYQSLSGTFPFEADSPISWIKKLEKEAPRDLRDAMQGRPLSEGLREIVMRGLEKEPARRPQSAQALRASLEALRAPQPLLPAKKRGRSPLWVGLPLAFFGLGYWVSQSRGERPAAPGRAPLQIAVEEPKPPSFAPASVPQPASTSASIPTSAPASSAPMTITQKKKPPKGARPSLIQGGLKDPSD